MTGLSPVDFRKGREHRPRLSPVRVPGRNAERYWTPEEEAVLRAFFVKGGAAVCKAHLDELGTPRRSLTSIYQQTRRLGLKAAHQANRPRQSWAHLRTPEMDTRIRDGWAQLRGRGAVQRFADELGVPKAALTTRALDLGLTSPWKKESAWTAPEESLLPTLPLHDLRRASQIMRQHGFQRSPTAIGVKAKRLEISRRRRDVFTGTRAARLFGMDSKTVTGWCIDGSLPATRAGTERLPQQGGDFWIIQPADLRQFVIDHIDRIDIRKVDKLAFVDLLVHGGAVAEQTPASSASPVEPSAPARSSTLDRRTRRRTSRRPLDEILDEAERGFALRARTAATRTIEAAE